MALVPITPPAGIVKNGTEYSNSGRWVDGNLVRFQNGFLTPIKGWNKIKDTAFTGTPIGMYAYYTNDGKKVLVVGTSQKVYVSFDGAWYDITPSGFISESTLSPLGFGAADFGEEDFGDARSTSGLAFDIAPFSFDNFGELLIFCCSSDGKIYKWDPSSPSTIASAVTNAPVDCQAVIVSNERHVIALGAGGDPRKIAWSSRETLTTWTAAATNTAGDIQVATGGKILSAIKWQTDIVIFTDTGINRMYYLGSPFLYGVQEAGTNCKAISPRTICSAGAFLCWMGENAFFIFDGAVKEIKSDVHDYVFDNMNYDYRKVSCGGHNSNYNEFWFFFPVGDTVTKPNKYVIFNYLDNVWSIGEMDRSCWIDQGVFDYPTACDSSGNIFEQESNTVTLNNSEGIGTSVPFAETSPIEIANGNSLVQCNQIIPDETANTLPGVTISFKGKFTPLGSETDFGSFTFNTDGYTDARFSARQVKMKVTGSTTQPFQVGKIRLDLKNRGKR